MNDEPEEFCDDQGRMIRPAFILRERSLMIFKNGRNRRRFIDDNRYALTDGIWTSEGKPDGRDVVVRDGRGDQWEIVPAEEAASLWVRLGIDLAA
ncbi:hypothetical protein G6L37_34980 [Agrobacterium rubi]|nr:hypothetical protein [Agrobacterium rubi]NTF23774.1 hypothetical protein [Agrobacterium rubi]